MTKNVGEAQKVMVSSCFLTKFSKNLWYVFHKALVGKVNLNFEISVCHIQVLINKKMNV